MSSLFGLLQVGYQGLSAQRALTETAGQNIANASTPGYRKQVVDLVSLSMLPGASLGGVGVGGIAQLRDMFLAREMRTNTSDFGQQQAMRETLEVLEPYINDLGGDGLSSALDGFFSSVNQLSADPSNLAARSEMLSSASQIGNRLSQLADAMATTRQSIDRQLDAEVEQTNAELARIAELNSSIASYESSGQTAVNLRDERAGLILSVSEKVAVRTVDESNGSVSLLIGGGQTLVQGGTAGRLVVDNASGGDTAEVRLAFDQAGGVEIGGSIGGRIGGLLEVRDGDITDTLSALDQFAYDFASAINTAHAAGSGLDGVSGRDFFEPIGTVDGAASLLRLSADVDGIPEAIAAAGSPSGLPGDNSVLLGMLDLAEQASFGGGSLNFADALAKATGTLSRRLSDARTGEEATAAVLIQVEQLHASRTGVSIEEELVNVTAAQRAFEAASKTLLAADELIQTVLQLV